MKNILKKSIGVMLVLFMLFSTLVGCVNPDDNNEQENNQSNNQDKYEYYAVKALYSYNEVINALSLVKERYDVKPTYTVNNMGDDYTVVYHFFVGHCPTKYPIDFETYFTTKSNGFFNTYIFLENEACELDEYHTQHASYAINAYKEDEDYDKIMSYKTTHPCVWLREITKDVVDINDRSLLSYKASEGKSMNYYDVYYNGEWIIEMISCVELDDAFFTLLFNSLITTSG